MGNENGEATVACGMMCSKSVIALLSIGSLFKRPIKEVRYVSLDASRESDLSFQCRIIKQFLLRFTREEKISLYRRR